MTQVWVHSEMSHEALTFFLKKIHRPFNIIPSSISELNFGGINSTLYKVFYPNSVN